MADYPLPVRPIQRSQQIVLSSSFITGFESLANLDISADEAAAFLLPALDQLQDQLNRLLISTQGLRTRLDRKPPRRTVRLWPGARLMHSQNLTATAFPSFGPETAMTLEGDPANNQVRFTERHFNELDDETPLEIRYDARGIASEPGTLPPDLKHAVHALALQLYDYRDGYRPPLRDGIVAPAIARWRMRPDSFSG